MVQPIRLDEVDKTGLLLVGHGSVSPDGVAENFEISNLVSELLPEVSVEIGFLELAFPRAVEIGRAMIAGGIERLVVQPVMLNCAGHVKSDIPAVVNILRQEFPSATIHYGQSLGVQYELIMEAKDKIERFHARGSSLLLTARGTSDPDANAEIYKAARLIADVTGIKEFSVGFSGVTWPSVPDALNAVARGSGGLLLCFSWYIGTGKLIERISQDIEQYRLQSGSEVINAGYFGPSTVIANLLVASFWNALDHIIPLNCDMCQYRRPFPGIEDRVGLEIGHGHSHLAHDHLHN